MSKHRPLSQDESPVRIPSGVDLTDNDRRIVRQQQRNIRADASQGLSPTLCKASYSPQLDLPLVEAPTLSTGRAVEMVPLRLLDISRHIMLAV